MVARTITVVQMLPDLISGGVERGTLEMGRYLSEQGHRSIVVSAGGRMVSQLEREKSRHVAWKVGRKTPVCLQYLLPLRRLLLRERVDILHLRSRLPAWVGYLAWRSLPAGRRPRLVTTFHGFYSVNAYSAVMTKGERVIAISRAVAEHIARHYQVAANRIEVIYRGFDAETFAPEYVTASRVEALRNTWGLQETTGPLIMLPGRLTRLKGHDIFIDSLAAIRELPWAAVCVGDKQENPGLVAELLQRAVRRGIAGRIGFVGHCDDMPAALKLADVVVSATSTHAEAFGRVAVEAQAMGKAVIASAHGGSLETVIDGKTGWLVKPADSVKLADALKAVVSDGEIRALRGAAGRRWVEKTFTVERMCRQTLAVYEDLLRGNDDL